MPSINLTVNGKPIQITAGVDAVAISVRGAQGPGCYGHNAALLNA